MVDEIQWIVLGADTKGEIYEGLLEKNAEDTNPARANTSLRVP